MITLPFSLCVCFKVNQLPLWQYCHKANKPWRGSCDQVVQEYERAVIFRLGRLLSGGSKGPGKKTFRAQRQRKEISIELIFARLGPFHRGSPHLSSHRGELAKEGGIEKFQLTSSSARLSSKNMSRSRNCFELLKSWSLFPCLYNFRKDLPIRYIYLYQSFL